MLFDSDGKIKKYVRALVPKLQQLPTRPKMPFKDTPKDILQDFAQVRLKMYETWWSRYCSHNAAHPQNS